MKIKSLVVACSMAFAGHAFAQGPTVTPDISLFISGSSAMQLTLGQIAKGLFVPGTVDAYFDAATNGKNYRSYFGTMKNTGNPNLDGKKVIIHNRANGGSVYGVNPVAQATAVTRNDVSATGGCTDSGTVDPISGGEKWTCTGTVNSVPDAGVSDVEPAMFVGLNLAPGTSALTSTELSHLSGGSMFGAPFTIIMTNNATGLIDNLNRAQVTSLMGGTITDWSIINPSVTTGVALSGGGTLNDSGVVVCRRVPGSGTQAGTNAYFFGYPCKSDYLPPADYNSSFPGYTVIENSGSGQLAACMTYVQNGTPAGQAIDYTNGSIVAAGSPNSVVLPGNEIGVGIMGLDRPPQAGELYHFENLNGVAPTEANAFDGTYDFMVENGFQWRNTTVNGIAPPSGGQADLIQLMMTKGGDPAILGDPSNPIPGAMGLTENGYSAAGASGTGNPAVFDPTYPVLKVGNISNTCKPLQQFQ